MTQPIAPKGAHVLPMSAGSAKSMRHSTDAASSPQPAHDKSRVDSVRISVAARRQLAVTLSSDSGTLQVVSQSSQQQNPLSGPGPHDPEAVAQSILQDLRGAFHTAEGDDAFRARLDFNHDGVINVLDMGMLREKLAHATGQEPVTIISDPMPAEDPVAVVALDTQTQDTASNAQSPLAALRAAFHTREGDADFNSAVDFNKDGVINAVDLGIAKRNMAEPAQPVPPVVEDTGGESSIEQTLASLRAAFYSREGDDGFDATVDFNNDGVINVRDLAMLRAGEAPGDSELTQPIAPQTPEVNDSGDRARTLVQQLREAFFSSYGDDHFRSSLDANGDGRINVADLIAARTRLNDDTA